MKGNYMISLNVAHLKIEKSRCSIAIWLAMVKIQIDSEGLQWCRKAEGGGMIFRNQRKCLKMGENGINFRHNLTSIISLLKN